MGDDFSGRPIPVRLAYRYPNGSMVSYSARALSYDGVSLRLVVNESFELGIALAVLAPFLEGLTTGLVFEASRSEGQPGYHEIVIRFDEAVTTRMAPSSTAQEHAKSRFAPLNFERSRTEGKNSRKDKPAKVIPAAIARAAEDLANGLYRLPPPTFSQVLQWTPPKSRPLTLLIGVAAVIHILEGKGLVHSSRLLRDAKGVSNK